MNSREGGSLFLKSFTESCVQEAIRQETLKKYDERISRIKRLPDIFLDIILTPLKILQELLRIVYLLTKWVAFILSLAFIFSMGLCVLVAVLCVFGSIMIYMYHIKHFGTCTIDLNKNSDEFNGHTFEIIFVEVMDPLLKSELLRKLHDYTFTYYRERNTNKKKETSQIQSIYGPPGPPGPVGPIGPPGCVGECRAG